MAVSNPNRKLKPRGVPPGFVLPSVDPELTYTTFFVAVLTDVRQATNRSPSLRPITTIPISSRLMRPIAYAAVFLLFLITRIARTREDQNIMCSGAKLGFLVSTERRRERIRHPGSRCSRIHAPAIRCFGIRERIKRKPPTDIEAARLASDQAMSDGTLHVGDVIATDRGFFQFCGFAPDGRSDFMPVPNPLSSAKKTGLAIRLRLDGGSVRKPRKIIAPTCLGNFAGMIGRGCHNC